MPDPTPISFQSLLDGMVETNDGDGHKARIPASWRQGRTAYGGATAGLSLEAALKAFPDLPPLRSAMINFIGPVSGDPVFHSKLLRQGRNVTFVQVEAYVGNARVSSVSFIFAASRPSTLLRGFRAPDASAPEDTPLFISPKFNHMAPVFLHNFEIRLIAGGHPMTGQKDGLIRVWVRHLDPTSQQGAVNFLALGDVLPPAATPLLTHAVNAISSINWTVNIIPEQITTQDGWWQVETRLTATQGGYSSQIMRYWNRSGDLIAEGTQLVAIFDAP